MWMLFATTLNVSMRFLRGRPWMAAVFGLTGGPLGAQSDQGEIVCACLGVTRGTIEEAIEANPPPSAPPPGPAPRAAPAGPNWFS